MHPPTDNGKKNSDLKTSFSFSDKQEEIHKRITKAAEYIHKQNDLNFKQK